MVLRNAQLSLRWTIAMSVFSVFSCATSFAFAEQTPAGTIMEVSGQVTVAKHPVKSGDKLYPHQLLVTGKKSKVHIHFSDGTDLLLGPKSRYVLNDYSPQAHGGYSKAAFLYQGALRTVTVHKRGEVLHPYVINTPAGPVKVIGTFLSIALPGCMNNGNQPHATSSNNCGVLEAVCQSGVAQAAGKSFGDGQPGTAFHGGPTQPPVVDNTPKLPPELPPLPPTVVVPPPMPSPPAVTNPPAGGPDAPKPPASGPDTPKPPAGGPDTPKPPAGGPDTPKPPAGGPGTPKPPAGGPDTPKPPAGGPGTPKPPAGGPDAPKPPSGGPDTPKPPAGGPDTPKPPAGGPDAPKPPSGGPDDAPKPPAGGPDTPKPPAGGPDTLKPPAGGPDTPKPPAGGPDTPKPPAGGPDTPPPGPRRVEAAFQLEGGAPSPQVRPSSQRGAAIASCGFSPTSRCA